MRHTTLHASDPVGWSFRAASRARFNALRANVRTTVRNRLRARQVPRPTMRQRLILTLATLARNPRAAVLS